MEKPRMASCFLRNPNTNFMINTDQVSAISAIPDNVNPNLFRYAIYTDPLATNPFYLSISTFSSGIAAIQAAYNLLVINLT